MMNRSLAHGMYFGLPQLQGFTSEDGVWKFISPEHREAMEQLFKENNNEWCAKASWYYGISVRFD